MRILQVMAGAKFGGAEAFFTRLVVALRRADVHQRVVIRKDKNRAKILRQGGIEPVEFRFGGPLDILTHMGLRREIASFSLTKRTLLKGLVQEAVVALILQTSSSHT